MCDDHGQRDGSPKVTPDRIVQFPRRKSLRVPQLPPQLRAPHPPKESECLLYPERVEADTIGGFGKNRESHLATTSQRDLWFRPLVNDSTLRLMNKSLNKSAWQNTTLFPHEQYCDHPSRPNDYVSLNTRKNF